MKKNHLPGAFCLALLLLSTSGQQVFGRPWAITGSTRPIEADYVETRGDSIILKGANGKMRSFKLSSFSADDQAYLKELPANQGAAGTGEIPVGDITPPATPTPAAAAPPAAASNKAVTTYKVQKIATLGNKPITLNSNMEVHLTDSGDPIGNGSVSFTSPDAWLFLDSVLPSVVIEKHLKKMRVNGEQASLSKNIRVVAYGQGAVVIPHAPDFAAMTVFDEKSFAGPSKALECFKPYNDATLDKLKKSISSFVLKRGYMATIAQNENGSGASINYVAQDYDLEVSLPEKLDNNVSFIRIFPWRWTSKKGIAGDIYQDLNVGWSYNWNLNEESTPDREYVPIRAKKDWPGLNQDWKARGSTHLLGFNEPDRPDQSKMSVDEAIQGWPNLMSTGLRLGSPATSDGGLNWLYEFINKADAQGLRVDFVPVHYYRAISDQKNSRQAADQLYGFLKGIHDKVKRPLWVTEWNNGANWTNKDSPDPTPEQQREAIAAMIKMMDETPFVERYSIYNWVEECRNVKRKDGSLTPAGEAYRDAVSPPFYVQEKPSSKK